MSKSYGNLRAVQDLYFEASAGEIIGLLGPNGAGKTTAIRVMTTILEPTRGSFSVNAIPHTRPLEIRRHVGVLPESSGYPGDQTGADLLQYFGRLYGLSRHRAEETAASLLAEVGLSARASSRISTYSRGMKQRLGVARALVNDPELILLDEPTLGLDPAGQLEMMSTIQEIAAERRSAVIISTHFLDEVESVCSDVLILNHGSTVAHGPIADIVRQAAVPETGRVRVPPDMEDSALAMLTVAPGVANVVANQGQRGYLTLTLHPPSAGSRSVSLANMNPAVAALVDGGVPILSLDVATASLSDAFFALTKEEPS